MNTKQQAAFDVVRGGQNLFLTGPAGTGKTFTLKHIIKWARETKKEMGVTASTGLAAYLIKGRTIHSFLGIGLGTKSARAMADTVRKNNRMVYARLRSLNILAIDEISMIDDAFFDKVSEFLSLVRENPAPFGGVQLILSGDMCQLPPVSGKYCFLAKSWAAAGIQTVLLEELVRQDSDTRFQQILQELRWGLCFKDTLKLLKTLKATTFENGVIPTKLYSVNVDVDDINAKEYAKLVAQGVKTRVYKTKYSGHPSTEAWSKSVKIPETVELCEGAQVLVTWNIPGSESGPGIVNGTRGVVLELQDEGPLIRLVNGTQVRIEYTKIACEDNDKICASFIPLKLAYAITIHKSQGMTLDAVEMDLGDSIFEYGQAYTALSRARTLSSVRITNVKSKSFRTHPQVKEFYGVV